MVTLAITTTRRNPVTGRRERVRAVVCPDGSLAEVTSRVTEAEIRKGWTSPAITDRPIAVAILAADPDSLLMICRDRSGRRIATYSHRTKELTDGSFRAAIRSMPHPARVRSITFASSSPIIDEHRDAAIAAAGEVGVTIDDFLTIHPTDHR